MSGPPSGDNYEREFERRLWNEGWASFRVAGSGTVDHASADLVAIKNNRTLILEVKSFNSLPIDLSGDSKQLAEIIHRVGLDGHVRNTWVGYALRKKGKGAIDWYMASHGTTRITDTNRLKKPYEVLNG